MHSPLAKLIALELARYHGLRQHAAQNDLSWNNVIWPFVVVTNTDMITMPVGLATMQSSYSLRSADIMASAVLDGLPLAIVFLFFQRQIVQGIASTGLEG